MGRKLATSLVTIAAGLIALPAAASGAASPALTKVGPGAITDNTAVLRDDLNPEGSPTHYYFQWGLTPAYTAASPPASAGAGTKPVAVSFKATGLLPGTVYHYRVVAQNGDGQTIGTDQTLKTTGPPPPGVTTGATGIGRNSATLTCIVNPNGAVTSYEFQYGLTPAYGSATPPAVVAAGAPATVSASVGGLEAGVWFHYRIVAFHGDSPPEYGADQMLLTEPFPRPVPRLTIASTPRHARRAPFSLTTLGKVAGPSRIPASLDCAGTVTVKVFAGRRRIAQGTSAVDPGCTFSVTTSIPRLRGRAGRPRTLKVVTAFAGNGYLAPRTAGAETITISRR
jgi:hypothetical protein